MMLQPSGVRSCEKAISTKRASIAINGSPGNQRGNKGVPIAGDEFAKTKQYAFRVFGSAELDYPSKEKKGDASRCRRRIAKKKNEVTEMLSLRRGRS